MRPSGTPHWTCSSIGSHSTLRTGETDERSVPFEIDQLEHLDALRAELVGAAEIEEVDDEAGVLDRGAGAAQQADGGDARCRRWR